MILVNTNERLEKHLKQLLKHCKSDCSDDFLQEDLVEAAFRFENELMELLGDVNTIPWDSYTVLEPEQLVTIIKTCVSDICKFKKG